jgi:LPXTG-site transpeptidase (sortase) family protein
MIRKLKITKKRLWLLVSVLLLAAAVYLLITALAPIVQPPSTPEHIYTDKRQQTIEIKENRLYIPKISVDVAIHEGTSHAVLEKGAWHRKPENGNPENGGNFVLSAHRFELGFTPQQTRARSPFYHVDKLQGGDKIYVDYNQKRYTYEVIKKYKVDRNAVQIEAPSTEPKMTLYSCELRGEKARREVIEAKPMDY